MIQEFEELLKSTNRHGVDKLLHYIRFSDFYEAPASTRFHSCHKGGLLEHSMNVYKCLKAKKDSEIWKDILCGYPDESLIIVSLLHDLCKTYYYVSELKNKKVYSEYGSKSDSKGKYDWQTVEGYTVDNKIPYGHGEKSVMMIENYITLTPPERYAIRWHMGFTEPKEYWNDMALAIKKYPLVLALHQADLESTYLLEEES